MLLVMEATRARDLSGRQQLFAAIPTLRRALQRERPDLYLRTIRAHVQRAIEQCIGMHEA